MASKGPDWYSDHDHSATAGNKAGGVCLRTMASKGPPWSQGWPSPLGLALAGLSFMGARKWRADLTSARISV